MAVAVSGGADSMALALLAAGWGRPEALIVDHGLRAGSAAEAERTRRALAGRAIPARVLTLTGLQPGPGLPARARAARYAALEAATAAAGLADLLLGHHAGDQAETVEMRRQSGSGARGLAGMAALSEGKLVRRLRPLLAVPPARLRAMLRAAGLAWEEDPTNQDQTYTRARLRAAIGDAGPMVLAGQAERSLARAAADRACATALAARACIFPEGYAVLTLGPIDPAYLAALLQSLSGQAFAPPAAAVAALARQLRPATLGGVRIMPAGRLGPGWLLVREAAALAPDVAAEPGVLWDGRFCWPGGDAPPGATIGGLGHQSIERRHAVLPYAVRCTLPAIRANGALHRALLPGHGAETAEPAQIILRESASPACGAPFLG